MKYQLSIQNLKKNILHKGNKCTIYICRMYTYWYYNLATATTLTLGNKELSILNFDFVKLITWSHINCLTFLLFAKNTCDDHQIMKMWYIHSRLLLNYKEKWIYEIFRKMDEIRKYISVTQAQENKHMFSFTHEFLLRVCKIPIICLECLGRFRKPERVSTREGTRSWKERGETEHTWYGNRGKQEVTVYMGMGNGMRWRKGWKVC